MENLVILIYSNVCYLMLKNLDDRNRFTWLQLDVCLTNLDLITHGFPKMLTMKKYLKICLSLQ